MRAIPFKFPSSRRKWANHQQTTELSLEVAIIADQGLQVKPASR